MSLEGTKQKMRGAGTAMTPSAVADTHIGEIEVVEGGTPGI